MDALALEADEGRLLTTICFGELYVSFDQRFPNGKTQHELCHVIDM